ncbi:MAG: nitroreductase family protein [Ignavibacteria bacterium]|nr:nitroreductase family protein [Ignavibacteria bacterium]
MAIPTSRTKEKAEIKILEDKCNGCGLCVDVCKDFSLVLENGKVKVSGTPVFGCIGCGHCMAICPNDAIEIHGRTLSPGDLFDLPSVNEAATYEQMLSLYQRRRSVREFKDKPVEPDFIEKILKAVNTVPMGIPPSDVNILVLDTKEKNRAFVKDFCELLDSMKWLVSGWFLIMMRPFWGKAADEMFRGFIKQLIYKYTDEMKKGGNYVTYDAPLALYFYGSQYSDPADPFIAATAAMYAGESLGLGTCMIGGVHPFILKGKKAKKFREKYGIKFPCKDGLIVIFGYPAVKYRKGISRTFASVTTLN